jgi:hypothetical protein
VIPLESDQDLRQAIGQGGRQADGTFSPGRSGNPKGGGRSLKERRILAAAEAETEFERIAAEFAQQYGRQPGALEAILLEQVASLSIDVKHRSKRGQDVSDARRLLLRASGQLPKPPAPVAPRPTRAPSVDAPADNEDVSDEALLSRAQLIEEEMFRRGMAGSDSLLNSLHKDAKSKVDLEGPARTVQVITATMTHAEAAAAYAETVRAGPMARIEAPAEVPQIEPPLPESECP